MAYLTNEDLSDGSLKMLSSLSPPGLVELFTERVDFGPQPRKPFGTMSATPIKEVFKVVGKIDPSDSTMRLRYDSQLQEGSAILVVTINKGEQGGSEVGLRFERAGLNSQEKYAIIGTAVLFWGMLLGMIGLVHDLVPVSEVQHIWFWGFAVTLVVGVITPLAMGFKYERDQGPLLDFARGLIRGAELDFVAKRKRSLTSREPST